MEITVTILCPKSNENFQLPKKIIENLKITAAI